MFTRKQYMSKEVSFHAYHAQFITEATKEYVLGALSVDDIKTALENGDKHLNKIKIPFNNMHKGGRWWWDYAPVNTALIRKAGESLSPATITCIAKACAKELAAE
jgi:hypothetical protein